MLVVNPIIALWTDLCSLYLPVTPRRTVWRLAYGIYVFKNKILSDFGALIECLNSGMLINFIHTCMDSIFIMSLNRLFINLQLLLVLTKSVNISNFIDAILCTAWRLDDLNCDNSTVYSEWLDTINVIKQELYLTADMEDISKSGNICVESQNDFLLSMIHELVRDGCISNTSAQCQQFSCCNEAVAEIKVVFRN